MRPSRISSLSALVLLVLGLAVTAGCSSSSPAATADKFIEAANQADYIEAAGYLVGAPATAADAEIAVKTILPADARAGYVTDEQGDASAKVILGDDQSSYMTLIKADGRWAIVEIGYTSRQAETESVGYATDYTTSDTLWEGLEEVTQAGVPGIREVAVETIVVNGQVVDVNRTPGEVVSAPKAAQAVRGTKPRGTGNVLELDAVQNRLNRLPAGTSSASIVFDRITRTQEGLTIELTIKNTGTVANCPALQLREKKQFGKWSGNRWLLQPGETQKVTWKVDKTLGVGFLGMEEVPPNANSLDVAVQLMRYDGSNAHNDDHDWQLNMLNHFWVGPFYEE